MLSIPGGGGGEKGGNQGWQAPNRDTTVQRGLMPWEGIGLETLRILGS